MRRRDGSAAARFSSPNSCSRFAVRGWIGKTIGRPASSAASSNAFRARANRSFRSTFSARWNVRSMYPRRVRPSRARTSDFFSAIARFWISASITLFPTTWTPAVTFSCPRFFREVAVRELVRHDPVQLLGHRLVEGPDPGFDVGQPPFLLLREEGPRNGRVRVPVDDHEVRVLRDAGDLPHRRGDLQVRRLLLQLELLVRLPELHVSEEDPVHHEVVMLTGMHEDMLVIEAVQGLHDRGHLDDFRAGPDDRDDAAHRRRRASNRGPALKIVPRAAQVETIITAPRLRAALLVSVVTTVRNEARNIAALLDSLVVQEPPFEIIVVDSASQDATRDIVRGYERQNESVRLYIFGGTRGAGRNFGIREAKGEAVAFIDGD